MLTDLTLYPARSCDITVLLITLIELANQNENV